MSHISHLQVYHPSSVLCEISKTSNGSILWVSGEYGTWFYKFKDTFFNCHLGTNYVYFSTERFHNIAKVYYTQRLKDSMPGLNNHLSLLSVLLKRMIVGAGVGFKRYLRVKGVGYKFELNNQLLQAKVGFTHRLYKTIPTEFYTKFSRKFKVIRFRSKSLTELTSVLSSMRSLCKPDIYKGKGIRYKRDFVRRKPGKRKTKATSRKKRVALPKIKKKKKVKKKKA